MAQDNLIQDAAARLHEAHRLATGSPVLWAWATGEVQAPFLAQAQVLADAGMLTSPPARPTNGTEAPTLGEIAEQLKPLKDVGVTRDSILYVIDKVWWEDAGAANRARLALAELTAANQRDREKA